MRFIVFAALLLTLIATPVLAQNGKNEDKSNNGQGQSKQEEKKEETHGNSQGNSSDNSNKDTHSTVNASTSPSPKSNSAKKLNTTTRGASGSAKDCDPNFAWKNHGEYVSCVAKSGAGGQAVSEAARSDIGKKSGTPSASLSPEASSSATPSAIVSPIPESTESAGLIDSITENLASVQEQIISIGDQFQALLDLLNPFN